MMLRGDVNQLIGIVTMHVDSSCKTL